MNAIRLLALIRDEDKVALIGKHSAGKPKILVHTAAGYHLATLSVSDWASFWRAEGR
jgi:hypothetical protein